MTNVPFAMRRSPRFPLRSLLFIVLVSGICYASTRNEPLVVVQNGKYGYIDHKGKVIIRPQFIWADDFWGGLGTVYVCGRYASIDSPGALLSPSLTVCRPLETRKSREKIRFRYNSCQIRNW